MNQSTGNSELRLIAGSGRSGTTWMLDVIAEANGLQTVFEPLHPEVSAVGRQFGSRYLVRSSECADLREMFAIAAAGRLRTVWTDYRIRPSRLRLDHTKFRSLSELKGLLRKWALLARRYSALRNLNVGRATIVKCIRANLMLDWVHTNFDARILLLMRHPGAAVESRLRFAEQWDPYPLLQAYREDPALMRGPLSAYVGWLTSNLSRAEALTAIWCIENIIPALQAAANGYVVVFYEELLERPDVEWARVLQGLGLSEMPSDDILVRPSQQSAVALLETAHIETYSKSYSSWRKRLEYSEVEDIAHVLKIFGIDFYDVSEDRPDSAAFSRTYLGEGAGTRKASSAAIDITELQAPDDRLLKPSS